MNFNKHLLANKFFEIVQSHPILDEGRVYLITESWAVELIEESLGMCLFSIGGELPNLFTNNYPVEETFSDDTTEVRSVQCDQQK